MPSCFEESTRKFYLAHELQRISAKERTMYYGIGGTIVIVLLVLFFLGRI
jgi:hypothetical protein